MTIVAMQPLLLAFWILERCQARLRWLEEWCRIFRPCGKNGRKIEPVHQATCNARLVKFNIPWVRE